jgi:hypothetical protein
LKRGNLPGKATALTFLHLALEISMKRLALPLAIALALSVPADGQPPGKGKSKGGPAKAEQTASISFGSVAEREIRAYFQTSPLAPQSLPPGIAKNLGRGKPLPPGIAKRALPSGLQTKLPSYPGHEVIIVDRDVILVDIATQMIVDILTRVL